MTSAAVPVTLDRLAAVLAGISPGRSLGLALAALVIGSALVLATSDDRASAGMAQQAAGMVMGCLCALGLAHGLAAVVGPLLAGA